MKVRLALILILLLASSSLLYPQISGGGKPAGFLTDTAAQEIPLVTLRSPDLDRIREEDETRDKMAEPFRVAVSVHAGISIETHGSWTTCLDGSNCWQVAVVCEGASGMSLCFDDFRLHDGNRLFVYDWDRKFLLGAFTSLNNQASRRFATEIVPGDTVIVELDMDHGKTDVPDISISEVSYVYRGMPDLKPNRGSSDFCEVNINCPEGNDWQKQKRGVVRIYLKENGGFFWCTGSLLNNTAQDLQPYLLTAGHCGSESTPEEMSQWIFYFNYESPDCNGNSIGPTTYTMTGAEKLATGINDGSDFLLLRFNEDIPTNYEPYFNGWNIDNIPSNSGVAIHHPAGDVKKVSTYREPLVSSQWGSTPNTHWQVVWSETENGWGVTEGGSSGAPLFDNNGQIIGNLTGGLASCEPEGGGTGPDQPDYFMKFSFSWDKDGPAPDQQLKYWLDPANTGISTLPGMSAALTASFAASETILLAGSNVVFSNLSSGLPVSWIWTFEGGQPSSFAGKNPPEVFYASGGFFDVSLVVSDGTDTDSLVLKDYIQVVGNVYPNPAWDELNIYLEAILPMNITAQVYNVLGQKVLEQEFPDQSSRLIKLDVSGLKSGIYVVRLQMKQRYMFAKFFKY